jgi:hypothetical protein
MTDDLLTTAEVAAILRRPMGTLGQWRWNKVGPPSFKLNGCVVYSRQKLEAWIEEQREATERKSA